MRNLGLVDKCRGNGNKKHKKQPFSDASASHLSLVLWHVWFQACLNQPLHITNAALLRGRWHRQKDKTARLRRKTNLQKFEFVLNQTKRHPKPFDMVGTRYSRPRQTAKFQYIIIIVSGREVSHSYHNVILIRGFSPWNGELFFRFLFLIPFTIRQQCCIYPLEFSTEPKFGEFSLSASFWCSCHANKFVHHLWFSIFFYYFC